MPQASREIRRRIRSIKNTRQITRAMEMVAAAKMRKAMASVLATRSYADLAWSVLQELVQRTSPEHHPLLKKHDKLAKMAILVISSNRGLCGGFNNQLANKINNYLNKQKKGASGQVELVTAGKKTRDILLRQGYTVAAEFTKADVTTGIQQALPLARLLINDYLAGKYDKIMLAYTDYLSAISQKPRLKQLLPIETTTDTELGSMRKPLFTETDEPVDPKWSFAYEYKFEPSPDVVLEDLLPRLLEIQIYQALLESDASEHSARMLAMRNATEAAEDMISSLTLAYNQARQQSITTELADITGGRVAVEG